MTSKLVVNEIAADTGISTITVGDNMSGVTFKTGTSNLHNVGIEIAGINVLGADTPIGAGATIYNSGDVLVGGAVTATAFSGSGASLTGLTAGQIPNLAASKITSGTVATARLGSGTANSSSFLRGDQTWAAVTSTTINNNANDRIITGSGTANTLEGESTLTFDSNGLKIHGTKKLYFGDSGTFQMNFNTNTFIEHTSASGTFYIQGDAIRITNKDRDETYIECDDEAGVKLKYANNPKIETTSTGVKITSSSNGDGINILSGNNSNTIYLDANRTGANNGIGQIAARWNGTTVGQIAFNTGSDTTDKNDGYIWFGTESAASNGNVNAVERARITSDGFVGIGEDDPQTKLVVKGTIASGRNVARELGTVINTSVQYNGSRAGTNVINGNKNYEAGADWLTPGGSRDNANLTIDLGTAINCDRFVIYNQNEYQDSKREVKNFTLEGSNDNSNWTTILDDDCGSSGAHEPNPGFSFRMPASYYDDNEGVSYRYWRFTMKDFHGSDGHGGVMELELWENDTTIHGTSEMCTSSVVAGDMSAETLQGIKRLYASKGMNVYTGGLTDTWEITEYGIVPSGSYQNKSTIRHKRGVMAVSSSYNSGDLYVRIDNLYNLPGNAWWVCGVFILSNEIRGTQAGGHHYVTSLQLMGIGTWNSVSTSNIVGSMSCSVAASGSNYVELFINVDDSSRGPCTVIATGPFDPPSISFA